MRLTGREYYNRMKAEKEALAGESTNAGTSKPEKTGTACRTEVK